MADDDTTHDDETTSGEEADAPKPKKTVKKKKKSSTGGASRRKVAKKQKTSSKTGKSSKTAKTGKSSKTATAKPAAPPPAADDDNTTMVALGAFTIACLAVVGVWWFNRDAEDHTTETTSIETPADEQDDRADSADIGAPGNEPARPPGPPPIPAPSDVAAIPDDATTTESGLAYRVLEAGTGDEHPGATDRVTVHYTGWTTDGEMFDSSRTRGQPATFPLNRVIAGWTEGVQLMVVGEQTRFWIPQDIAYGGRPGAPAGMLVFDVELVSFEATPQPPPTPDDVASIPANATTTESGLAYRVLEAGTGTEHPEATSRVSVNYTGWTTDGEMFDSSITRGRPASFRLNGVIAGWTEGLQLMVVGEKTRFWIPESLAYGGRSGAPAGMLVFDVELLEILPAGPPPGLPPNHP